MMKSNQPRNRMRVKPAHEKAPKNSIRAFFAINLPDVLKKELADIIKQLQTMHQRAPIRWVKLEHLHITLQFLESVKLKDVGTIATNVRNALKDKKSIAIQLGEVELFPSSFKPKVISITVNPHNLLADLAKSVGQAIRQSGYQIENRPFRAHLTLGRVKETRRPIILEAYKPPPIPAFRANTVVFYKSEPTSEGPSYIPLDRIILNN